ncbi:MAG: hypothetical protein JXA42_08905 [Anaerolineales bacterium]|nr:hypothetical protein [Anaerolineales bacterium]
MMSKNIAVVLGLFDTGLGVVRSLGRSGIRVLGLDSNTLTPGFRSRYCTPKQCPDPVHDADALVDFLLREASLLDGPGILFPASDAFVLFVSRSRQYLAADFNFILPPESVIESIVDKRRQYELVEQAGLFYPATFHLNTMGDVDSIKNELDYPVFIKPTFSHLWRDRFGGLHKGFKVYSAQELQERFQQILPTGLQVLVQSIIPGPNTNHFKVCVYINEKGQPLAVFTLRKIRQYPTEFGVGTLVESIHYPELAAIGLEFFQRIGFRGIGSIEFKLDECDNQLKFIELNPRFWQQNALATTCGMNFPLVQYLDLTGQHPEPLNTFTQGVKWLDASADFQSFWTYFLRGELSPWDWLRSLAGVKSFATFAKDDMRPFLRANEHRLKQLFVPSNLFRRSRKV